MFDYLKNCLRGVFFQIIRKMTILKREYRKITKYVNFQNDPYIYIHNNDYAKLFRNLYDYTASNGIFFETFHKV